MSERKLKEWMEGIRPLDRPAMEAARQRWNSIAKPLYSLGSLEDAVVQIAGITGDAGVRLDKRGLIVMCADNGVVEEGVTQTGQEVTAIVAENFLTGDTSAAIMCEKAGVRLFPVDIGMAVDTKVPGRKIRRGTGNIVKGPAMSREEALQAVLEGIDIVRERKEEGYQILCTGEMGIGNTTTSSAVACVLLSRGAEELTGCGAGLDAAGLERKIQAVQAAVERNRPDPADPMDGVSRVGGLDLAGLLGVYLGGACFRIPVVVDGFISAVAALLSVRMCPLVREYLLASHTSKEPGTRRVMEALKLQPGLDLGMCLGEGTGAVAFLPVLDMACAVYERMGTFTQHQIEDYKDYRNLEECKFV